MKQNKNITQKSGITGRKAKVRGSRRPSSKYAYALPGNALLSKHWKSWSFKDASSLWSWFWPAAQTSVKKNRKLIWWL